jgi:hypothetical protein
MCVWLESRVRATQSWIDDWSDVSGANLNSEVTRRHALTLGGGAAASVLGAGVLAGSAQARDHAAGSRGPLLVQHGKLPAHAIQQIVQAQGTVSGGLLDITLSRGDIGPVQAPIPGVIMDGAFEVNGDAVFQPLGDNLAFFNGDLALKESEVQGFIAAVMANGLIFQALHQHFIGQSPQTWFVHWRGVDEPHRLAAKVHNVLTTTSIQLPQTMPINPTSPLNAKRLGKILGAKAMIGEEGVVSVNVDRAAPVVVNNYPVQNNRVQVSPGTNISNAISFKPLSATGSQAAGVIDFAMTGAEVQPVEAFMQAHGWFIGCLYNQETAEHPQLYFTHFLKVGDAYELATEIRQALAMTNVKFK